MHFPHYPLPSLDLTEVRLIMWAANRLFSCGFFLLVLSSVAAGQTSGIPWQQNLEAAKQQARVTGKLVLVHFWADWCPACVRFEKTVFNQPEVAQAIDGGYVAVKLNADHFPSTARAMSVRTLPTDIIITPDGREVARFTSEDQRRRVATANGFVTEITRLAEVYKPGAAVTIAARAPQTVPTQTALGGNMTVPPATNPYTGIGQSYNPGIATQSGNRLTSPVSSGVPVSSSANPSANIQMPTATPNFPTSPSGTTTPQLSPNNTPTPQPAFQNSQPFAPVTSYPNNRTTANLPIANSPVNSSPINGAAGGAQSAGRSRYVSQSPQATPQGMTTSTTPAQPFVANPFNANPPAAVATTPAQTPTRYSAQARPRQSAPVTSQRAISQPVTPSQPQPTLNQPVPSGQTSSQAARGSNLGLGLDGYCPVTLQHERRWVVGDRRWGVNHEGRTYLFMGPTQQQLFYANPNLYSPVLAGADPVLALETGQSVPGSRRHGVVYDSHVFLFSSEATLQRFTQDPDRFVNGVHQALKLNRGQLPPR